MMNKTTDQSEPEIDFSRLCSREKKEVDRWFDRFSDPVYGFIFYRVGRDADLAGDVAQETFVTALTTIDRFDPGRCSDVGLIPHRLLARRLTGYDLLGRRAEATRTGPHHGLQGLH